jgi:hypothetical protein
MSTSRTTRPTSIRLRRLAPAGAVALALVAGAAACSPSRPVAACADLDVGDGAPAVVITTDGAGASLDRLATAVEEHPEQVFASRALGLDRADDELGIVALTTYDATGRLVPQGTFDLRGVGDVSSLREDDAARQAECFVEAVGDLPAPTDEAADRGDLVRALPRAADEARRLAGDEDAAVVAVGFGRSAIEGNELGAVDLSDEGRAQVFADLDAAGLVLPDLTDTGVGVVFLDPAEGVPSDITAHGLEAFADDLCERLRTEPCSTELTVA